MTTPILRRAVPADTHRLADIGRETFVDTFGALYPPADLSVFLHSAYDPGATRASLQDPAQASWLLEDASGQALGYATAGPCGLPHAEAGPEALELKRIYLRRNVQGGGLGGVLFDTVMRWMAAQSPPDVWIGVWSENFGAQRFYARRGFQKVGEYGFPVGNTIDREFILRRRPAF